MALPYPGMDFTPFNTLPAADLDKLAANIEALSAGTGLATTAITRGYTQITGSFSTVSTSPVQVTGLTSSVTIPAGGRKIKITCFIYEIYNSTALSSVLLSIWDGTVGSGTELATSGYTSSAANAVHGGVCMAVVTPSAGAKTYNIGLQTVGGGTANIASASTAPSFILVEAI